MTLPDPFLPDQGVRRNFEALDQRINELRNALMPTGTVLATGRSAAPDGFLLCDGSAVSRTTYADLFAAISTTYGTGDGSTTFNLPDLRGRVPVGVDGAAGRIAANDALGNTAGAETHALSTAELPAHTHGAGSYVVSVSNPVNTTTGGGAHRYSNAGGSSVSVTGTSGSTGSDTAHNNLQPYQIVNYMVKI